MWYVYFYLFNALLFLFCLALPLQIVLTSFILRSNQYAHAQKATLKKKSVLNLSPSLFPAVSVIEK